MDNLIKEAKETATGAANMAHGIMAGVTKSPLIMGLLAVGVARSLFKGANIKLGKVLNIKA